MIGTLEKTGTASDSQATENGKQGDFSATPSQQAYDVEAVRSEFPILRELVRGKPLVYLDNAATTQKPQAVLDALAAYYTHDNANVHRGVHMLSERATKYYEEARSKVQKFLNAARSEEIIYTRNATESINLVAQTYGRQNLRAGDEVIVSEMEHHSNIVPWQMVCEATGAILRVVPITDAGELRMDEYARLLSPKTKIVAIVQQSNALGTVNPVEEITRLAHEVGAAVLIDGSQAVYHRPVDVQAIGCDFYVFTGHKLYGPTGIGILYGKSECLNAMPPYMGGGDMISSVTFEKTTYNVLPYKFEAGTPNIAGAIGLGAAIDWVNALGLERIAAHEASLLAYGTEALQTVPGLRLVGTAPEKASVLSFVMADAHPHDVGTILDQQGIAIRTGHHCAQPVMKRFGIPATARASFGCYNTHEEIDALVRGLHRVAEVFG